MKFNFNRVILFILSFLFSLLIPRSNSRVVIGSRDERFADNSRYFFIFKLKNFLPLYG